MDADLARWLTSDAAGPALAAAASEADPSSLGAATRLRALVNPEQAAAVLTQVVLRRKASAKFGARADRLWFTPDGLEQATRPRVAARRAARFARVCDRVVDLGCGIGSDALALLDAGLTVDAVERDPAAAILAGANLARADLARADLARADSARGDVERADLPPAARVHLGDASDWWPRLARPGVGVFCDPARRTASGRTWRIEDLSPPWAFAESLLDGARPACLKLGPGVPHRYLPGDADVEWVSDGGTVVECAVWAGPGAIPGRRTAVVDGVELSSGRPASRTSTRLRAPTVAGDPGVMSAPPQGHATREAAGLEDVGDFLYDPDGAVVRAGLVDELAGLLRAHRLAAEVAYLTSPWHLPTPFADCFAVREVMPYDEKRLRGWVRERGIGTLEIKKRALDVDPAALRRRLKLKGHSAVTIVLAPSARGAIAVVCDRLPSR